MTNSFNEQIMHQQALCSALEILINKTLLLNEGGTGDLPRLSQQTLTIILQELGYPISFSVDTSSGNNQILVTTLTQRSDCTIKTSIKTLIQLQKEKKLTELIKQDKLDIDGDIKTAQGFAHLAESIEIDWQSEIAKHIGDVATYKLSKFTDKLRSKLVFAAKQITADSSEWLVHEKRLVVTSSQIKLFSSQVDELSCQASGLEQRIEQLTNLMSDTAQAYTTTNSTTSNTTSTTTKN